MTDYTRNQPFSVLVWYWFTLIGKDVASLVPRVLILDSMAEKAMSDAFARLRYRDTSLLIWQQQQLELEKNPTNYLNRSRSATYSHYGNQTVIVRDRTSIKHTESGSKICSLM